MPWCVPNSFKRDLYLSLWDVEFLFAKVELLEWRKRNTTLQVIMKTEGPRAVMRTESTAGQEIADFWDWAEFDTLGKAFNCFWSWLDHICTIKCFVDKGFVPSRISVWCTVPLARDILWKWMNISRSRKKNGKRTSKPMQLVVKNWDLESHWPGF